MKLMLLCMVSLLVISCTSSSLSDSKNIEAKLGWLHGNCLAIKNASIAPQTQLTLVYLNEEKTTEQAVITKVAIKAEECNALLDDRAGVNRDTGYFFYLVKSAQPVNLAIGVLAPESAVGIDFASCSTTEGIQFSVSKHNAVIWQGYYYLGYESEPTCK